MKKEIYRTLKNPATKHVALEAINQELEKITNSSNIINLLTDNKVKHDTPYIRTTVFVENKKLVNFKNLDTMQVYFLESNALQMH